MRQLEPAEIADFQDQIYAYYKDHARVFPWRETTDPYHILVSEVMLQQTQVDRVVPKYQAFISRFPNFKSLSKASVQDIYQQWQGLGYNRRALALKKLAEQVISEHAGVLPQSLELLVSLPGIGEATAGAILAYAFNRPVVFIETNIRRVYIHHFFTDSESVHDHNLLPLIEQTLDHENPRQWYYALMDYGSMLGKAMPNPNRRSRHYTKQSTFEGSNRQIRGKILKILAAKRASLSELKNAIPENQPSIKPNLDTLIKEGFIIKHGRYFRLAA